MDSGQLAFAIWVLSFAFSVKMHGTVDSVSGLQFPDSGSWFTVWSLGFRFRVACLRCRDAGFGFRVSGYGFQVSSCGFWVSGFRL